MGRTCLINDCTGFKAPAPCCLDCDQRDQCPDRCWRTETTFCVGVIEVYNDKDTSRTIKK